MEKWTEYDVDRVSTETLKEVAKSFLEDSQKAVNIAIEKLRKEARVPPSVTLVERNDNIAAVVLSYFKETRACIGKDSYVNFGRWNDEQVRLLNEYCAARVDPAEIPEPPLTERARNDRIAQIMVAYYRSERTNRPTAEKVSFVSLQEYEKKQLNKLCSSALSPEPPPCFLQQEAREARSNRRKANICVILDEVADGDLRSVITFPYLPHWFKAICKEELDRREELRK